MNKISATPSVTSYIATHKGEVAKRLRAIRAIVKKSAPGATEGMAYGMPAYKLDGKPLVYFAGFAKHVGLYALPKANVVFKKELAKYKVAKGSIQFQHDEPLPLPLIRKIIAFRVKELRPTPRQENKQIRAGLPSDLGAPALRALLGQKIDTLAKVAKHTETDMLSLHGLGPSAVPKLKRALKKQGLAFKK